MPKVPGCTLLPGSQTVRAGSPPSLGRLPTQTQSPGEGREREGPRQRGPALPSDVRQPRVPFGVRAGQGASETPRGRQGAPTIRPGGSAPPALPDRLRWRTSQPRSEIFPSLTTLQEKCRTRKSRTASTVGLMIGTAGLLTHQTCHQILHFLGENITCFQFP